MGPQLNQETQPEGPLDRCSSVEENVFPGKYHWTIPTLQTNHIFIGEINAVLQITIMNRDKFGNKTPKCIQNLRGGGGEEAAENGKV